MNMGEESVWAYHVSHLLPIDRVIFGEDVVVRRVWVLVSEKGSWLDWVIWEYDIPLDGVLDSISLLASG